ncbi:putative endonuclease G [Trypanosoma cruzi]|nr:putative endonuclease G [Trypanosoma cruzi]
MPLFPSSAIGRALMLLSATLFGTVAGVAKERASGKRLQHEQEFVPIRDAEQMDAARMVLSPFMQQTVSKGLPSDERLRFFDSFVASLNYERRIPNWVLEYFPSPAVAEATAALRGEEKEEAGENEEEGPNGARRGGIRFFADTTVPEAFRVTPDDYTGGREQQRLPHTRGLSRGHLAAAQFHKHSTKEMTETFNMNANVVPQDMTMNALDWLRLENLMKKLLLRYEGGIWVVTGPVFSPRYVYGDPRSWGWTESRSTSAVTPATTVSGVNGDMKKARKVVCYELVGKHDVAVPTHLFKVVLGERGDGSHEVAAFLIPNEPIVSERPACRVPSARDRAGEEDGTTVLSKSDPGKRYGFYIVERPQCAETGLGRTAKHLQTHVVRSAHGGTVSNAKEHRTTAGGTVAAGIAAGLYPTAGGASATAPR